LWTARKEYDKAVADFSHAVKLDPKNANSCNALAWLQATCPDQRYRDGKNAVVNALRAVQLSGGKNGEYTDTLAAAYAESGDFAKAREWETKAISLAVDEKKKQGFRSRLELYKQSKPYRIEAKSP
jgi:Flp pilus assembly protein TadD